MPSQIHTQVYELLSSRSKELLFPSFVLRSNSYHSYTVFTIQVYYTATIQELHNLFKFIRDNIDYNAVLKIISDQELLGCHIIFKVYHFREAEK